MLKRFLPASLFGRALLILALPAIIVQAIAVLFFYERHWDSVSRNLANALAGELGMVVGQLEFAPDAETRLLPEARSQLGMKIRIVEGGALPQVDDRDDGVFYHFAGNLRNRIGDRFALQRLEDGYVRITVALQDGRLAEFTATSKRLANPTVALFVLFTVGIAGLLLAISVLFLRNQIRPIARLADAAEAFGRGEDMAYAPSGAREVRQAGYAFLEMQGRIRRQVGARTEMLAGISHDLRTPLTRLTLQLAMLPEDETTREMAVDVRQMQLMVNEYLDFARGDAGEELGEFDLATVLEDAARSTGHADRIELPEDTAQLAGRPRALRRAFTNVMENALRYGNRCEIRIKARRPSVTLWFEDDGPGIPESQYDQAMQPFTRLDSARGSDPEGHSGGVGLGLAIVRDIVHRHGGTVTLGRSKTLGGLQVKVTLPR